MSEQKEAVEHRNGRLGHDTPTRRLPWTNPDAQIENHIPSVDTEQSASRSWRFRSFLAGRKVPGFGATLGWLGGEFDEFFLQPLHTSRRHRNATMQLLRSFEWRHVDELGALHERIEPVLTAPR